MVQGVSSPRVTSGEAIDNQIGCDLLIEVRTVMSEEQKVPGRTWVPTCAEEAAAMNAWFSGLSMAYVMMNMSARMEYNAADSTMIAASDTYCLACSAGSVARIVRRYVKSRIVMRIVRMMFTLREMT